MSHLSAPYLALGIGMLMAGAEAAWRARRPRVPALAAAAGAFGCFLQAAREVCASGEDHLPDPALACLDADALGAVPMAFFSALTLLVVALAPRRDAGGSSLAGMLLLSAATQVAYGAATLAVLAAGWWLMSVPFLLKWFGDDRARRLTQGFLIASSLALSGAVVLLHMAEAKGPGPEPLQQAALCLVIAAVMLHKGVFPLHGWVVSAFERGPLLPMVLLFNGHLGALIIARPDLGALSRLMPQALDVLSTVALITALITSLRGFAETRPRRLLALLSVSQASFILAGIATANTQGITGALVHCLVVTAASTGLICVVRMLEARVPGIADPEQHLGLAVKAPRLATFFLVCGLALIGLPGTLGYCAEDLLFHGALKSRPWLGLALPVATAFNAINLIRLHGILFLGVLPKQVIDIPDALPRERWPLTACVVFLVAGGLFPAAVLRWREQAAHEIEAGFGPRCTAVRAEPAAAASPGH